MISLKGVQPNLYGNGTDESVGLVTGDGVGHTAGNRAGYPSSISCTDPGP